MSLRENFMGIRCNNFFLNLHVWSSNRTFNNVILHLQIIDHNHTFQPSISNLNVNSIKVKSSKKHDLFFLNHMIPVNCQNEISLSLCFQKFSICLQNVCAGVHLIFPCIPIVVNGIIDFSILTTLTKKKK